MPDVNAIDWSRLEHSHGSAKEVPSWLAALGSDSRKEQARALDCCWSYLVHQGTRYEASVRVVPFLFDVLKSSRPPLQQALIELLLGIAVGLDERFLPWGYDLQLEEQRFRADSWDGLFTYAEARDVYYAVERSAPSFVEFLHPGVDPGSRLSAVYAVAHFAQSQWALHTTIADLIRREADPVQLQNLLLCFGMLGRFAKDTPGVEVLSEQLQSDRPPGTRVATAIALTTIRGLQTPEEAVQILLTALREAWRLAPEGPLTLPWNEGDLLGYAAMALRLLGPEQRADVAGAVCAALVNTEVSTFALPHTLLDLLFPEPAPEGLYRIADFDDVQRTSLRTLLLTKHWRSWMLSGRFLPVELTGDDYFRALDNFLAEATGQDPGVPRDLSSAGNVSSWDLNRRPD